jgi:stage V sporulation protein S
LQNVEESMENIFKVSSGSHSTSIAGAIAKSIRDGNEVVLQAIGAGAVNQTVKAIAIARSYLVADNLDIAFVPAFVELDVEGNERTAVRFYVRQPGQPFPPAAPIGHSAPSTNGEGSE